MSGDRLFQDQTVSVESIYGASQRGELSNHDAERRASCTRRSALWAAYGDALGFISELTDAAGLQRRTHGAALKVPIPWKRRIGGRNGVQAQLPVGCYSDDTQLRLSTARTIGPHGFDVEAFARVELPVWLGYALGGGNSTKAAATNLARPNAAWFANTYSGWTSAGGNGAAMRIQPHVWSAAALDDPSTYLLDVIRNAICTHAHPGALLGAALHAMALAHALASGAPATPGVLTEQLAHLRAVPSLIHDDSEVGELWLSAWERVDEHAFCGRLGAVVRRGSQCHRCGGRGGKFGQP